jgi:hypothetical protein
MPALTRTYSAKIDSSYVADTIINLVDFGDIDFTPYDSIGIYLDQCTALIDIPSLNIGKIPNLTGDETAIEESLAMSAAELNSQKVGLQILEKKAGGVWLEIAEFILLNYGRKDYLDLRVRLGYPSRILEKSSLIGVKLIDYGDGLLWATDSITLNLAVSIELKKNNDFDELLARIASLELALDGRLINLPADTILGRDATTGTVETIPQSRFLVAPLVDSDIPVSIQRVGAVQQSTYDSTTNYLTNFLAETDYLSTGGSGTFPLSTYGSAYGYLLSEVEHPGIVGIASGNNGTVPSGGGTGTGNGSVGGILFSNGTTTYVAIIRIPILRTSVEDFLIECGFQTAGTSIGLDACCFVYDGASLSWQCHTRKAGALSIFAANVLLVAGSWYTLKIIVLPTGLAQFFINGTMVVETATTMPTSAVNAAIDFRKTVGTSGRDIHIDYQSVRQTFVSPRS